MWHKYSVPFLDSSGKKDDRQTSSNRPKDGAVDKNVDNDKDSKNGKKEAEPPKPSTEQGDKNKASLLQLFYVL